MRDRFRTALAASTLCFIVLSAGAVATPAAAAAKPTAAKAAAAKPAKASKAAKTPKAPKAPKVAPSDSVARFSEWVIAAHDNGDLPFVIVDKLEAAVFVFQPDGALAASTPALLGLAPGDDSAPGIGEKDLADIPPEERTTPAGRFLAGFRPNPGHEEILWVDYDTSVSLHPLRQISLNDPREQRLHRLKTSTPADNRITYGCINVPDAFYDKVVRPAFQGAGGVVYVLPETHRLAEVFPTFEKHLASDTSDGPDRKKKKKGFWKRLF